MDENTSTALYRSQVIDLTTTGRRTGRSRRIEIFLHEEDGWLFISGMPRADRTRDWIHNITADPHVVVHLKQPVSADIPATARVVTDLAASVLSYSAPMTFMAAIWPGPRSCGSSRSVSCLLGMRVLALLHLGSPNKPLTDDLEDESPDREYGL